MGGEVDLYGRTFNFDRSPAGVLSAISAETGHEDQPALAAQNGANALVVCERYVEARFRGERLRARRVQLP